MKVVYTLVFYYDKNTDPYQQASWYAQMDSLKFYVFKV